MNIIPNNRPRNLTALPSMKQLAYCFLMLLSLLWLGCRRDKSPTIYVHKEMLPYCWFPNGGYWVYEDVTTPGVMDSAYTTGNSRVEIIPDGFGLGYEAEHYVWGYFFRGHSGGQGITANAYGDDFEFSSSLMKESFTDSAGEQRSTLLFWDNDRPDSLGYPWNLCTVVRLDSIVIAGTTYHDVIQVTNNPPEGTYNTIETVWARGVGIVRRTMTDASIWELVRYHIH